MSTEVKPTDWDEEDNRWEPTPSGGGSGLPPYTSADKGKVLTIGDASPISRNLLATAPHRGQDKTPKGDSYETQQQSI